jgi:hypothetical protein
MTDVGVNVPVSVATAAMILDLCRHTRTQGGDAAKLAETIMARLGY